MTQTFTDTGQATVLIGNLKDLKQSFDSGIAVQTVFVSTRTLEKVGELGLCKTCSAVLNNSELKREITSVDIEHLKLLRPARMDVFSRPKCLPGTRQEILNWITDWLITPSQSQNILWLHGLAGSGKSTISTTIAEYFRELKRLGAFMFFDRSDPTNSEPAAVVRTLSYKLASFHPAIRAAICAQIESEPGITEAHIHTQFSKLILEPVSSLPILHNEGPIIVILDAFDECGDSRSRGSLLTLLAQQLEKFPSAFRFVITSRREFDIESALSRRSNIMVRELDIGSDTNSADICTYLRHHTALMRTDPMLELAVDWPGEEKVQVLASSAAGLFIWASTAVKFIEDGIHPDQQLDILLHPHPREAESALDALYAMALRAAAKWDSDDVCTGFRAVLGAIVTARAPLSDTMIDRLFSLDGPRSSRFILSRLRCLFQWSPGQPAWVLHASFQDYLTDPKRCGDQHWFIDTSFHHHHLALSCFRTMKTDLKFNICDLETSHVSNDDVLDLPDRIQKYIPNRLSYSCRFWAEHVRRTKFRADADVIACLDEFLCRRLLYWLEVLSLIKAVHIASPALSSIVDWFPVSSYAGF